MALHKNLAFRTKTDFAVFIFVISFIFVLVCIVFVLIFGFAFVFFFVNVSADAAVVFDVAVLQVVLVVTSVTVIGTCSFFFSKDTFYICASVICIALNTTAQGGSH